LGEEEADSEISGEEGGNSAATTALTATPKALFLFGRKIVASYANEDTTQCLSVQGQDRQTSLQLFTSLLP